MIDQGWKLFFSGVFSLCYPDVWYLDVTMNRVKMTKWCIITGTFRKIVNWGGLLRWLKISYAVSDLQLGYFSPAICYIEARNCINNHLCCQLCTLPCSFPLLWTGNGKQALRSVLLTSGAGWRLSYTHRKWSSRESMFGGEQVSVPSFPMMISNREIGVWHLR